MAKGIALITLLGMSSMSGATPIESSINMSALPLSFAGMGTDTDLACANGMSVGSDDGLPNLLEILSYKE
jgi:hypothetical protein